MDSALVDLTLTYGLATGLVLVGMLGIIALPWRSSQARASAAAWSELSVMSGGFARDRVRAMRRFVSRLGEASARRPGAALTRTLS
jgi:hypothetical protein